MFLHLGKRRIATVQAICPDYVGLANLHPNKHLAERQDCGPLPLYVFMQSLVEGLISPSLWIAVAAAALASFAFPVLLLAIALVLAFALLLRSSPTASFHNKTLEIQMEALPVQTEVTLVGIGHCPDAHSLRHIREAPYHQLA